jgi:Tfp pilus assembly protein PilF
MRRSRNLLPLLGLFLFVVPLAAQDPMEVGDLDQGSIQGTLRDSATGREVPDARVELNGPRGGGTVASAITNSAGGFLLDLVPKGNYTITVQHPDYLPFSQDVTTNGGPVFGVQLALRRKPVAAGAPVSPAPAPAPGPPARATGIPRAAQDAMNRGMDLLYVKSDPRGSLGQFERAIREYSGFYEAYTQMGAAHTNLGDSAEAEQAFRKAIELSQGRFAEAYVGLAIVLSNGQRFADAESAARKAVELNSNDWRGHGELSRALHGLKRYQDAEAPSAVAAKLAPDNPTLQLLRTTIHLQLKNLPAMIEDLDAYLKLVPTGPEADRMRELRAKVQEIIASTSPAPQASPSTPAP